MIRSRSVPRSKVSSTAEFDRQVHQTSNINNPSHHPSAAAAAGGGAGLFSGGHNAFSTVLLPCPASLPRLMFPRCSNEVDVGAVELARRESQHFLYNTDVIVSQRDEIRQLSKDLVAQAKDAADKLEKSQIALRAFYSTLGRMADNLGRTYTGNREIGQELIRLTARHKEACDILADVTSAFRRFSGAASSRAGSPESSGGSNPSVIDRVSKQFQKECEATRKENDDLKKSLEDMGQKYGSSVQGSRRGSIGKVKRMDGAETAKYLSKAARTKELFVSSLTQQRRFMCIFSSSLCSIVDHELRLANKLTGCEPIYCTIVKNITHIDKLPDSALQDIKQAGQVSSTDVIFKSTGHPNANGPSSAAAATALAPGEPQYDSISQTSSLGSSTSLSTNASTESPGGTSSSLTDSGFPSSRESSHDDPDYRDPALYYPNARSAAATLANRGGASIPAPPPRRGSYCQPKNDFPSTPSNSSINSMTYANGSSEKLPSNRCVQDASEMTRMSTQSEIRVTCNDIQQFAEETKKQFDNNSLIRPFSKAAAAHTLTQSTITQQRLSHPVLPMSSNRSTSPASPGSESIACCYSTDSSTDIWVPREDAVIRNESPQSRISKSQSSSTDTLEATDSPSQTRRLRDSGVSESLNSSTDTLDDASSPSKTSAPTAIINYSRSRGVPQSNTTQNFTTIDENSADNSLEANSLERAMSDPQGYSDLDSNDASDSSKCASASGSDSEQFYTTIKRSPKTLVSPGKTEADTVVVSTESSHGHEDDVSDFMKQLQRRRQTLNTVDKNSLPFWASENDSLADGAS